MDYNSRKNIEEVIREFDLESILNIDKLPNGLINDSFKVETPCGIFVIQRLSSLWDERVIKDYQAVQSYLRTNGLNVPVLINSNKGNSFYRNETGLWRAFEYIPNDALDNLTPTIAYEAGRILGKFHNLMEKAKITLSFSLPGYRDTPGIIKKLESVASQEKYSKKARAAVQEAGILFNVTPHYFLPSLPKTVIHGDPKIANFLIRDNRVVALLDLDTMMYGSELLDIGDALRSWCRVKPASAQFREEIYEAAIEGYNIFNPQKYTKEQMNNAMSLITLELAARYLIDYFEESYFLLSTQKYGTLAEQNLTRCRRYIEYYKNFTGGYQRNNLLYYGLMYDSD